MTSSHQLTRSRAKLMKQQESSLLLFSCSFIWLMTATVTLCRLQGTGQLLTLLLGCLLQYCLHFRILWDIVFTSLRQAQGLLINSWVCVNLVGSSLISCSSLVRSDSLPSRSRRNCVASAISHIETQHFFATIHKDHALLLDCPLVLRNIATAHHK